ncbi:MAG: hypothetical protein ACKV22_15460 [Bryobacteraceae bacterium]
MASWFDFLRIEADLAMTFIGSARILSSPADAVGSLENARKALAEIQRGLLNPAGHGLSEDEVLVLMRRCVEIESELATF